MTTTDEGMKFAFVIAAVEESPYWDSLTEEEAVARWDEWIARVRRDAAREALDGLSTWLGELAEKHPTRTAYVPLAQGNITRYTTDHYPEETP